MEPSVNHEWSRRQVVGGGAFAGLLFIVGGCQSAKVASDLPGPLWPDQKPKPPAPPPVVTAPRPAAPAPTPRPATPVPGVVARGQWTRNGTIASLANPIGPITRITIHHDAIPSTSLRTMSDSVRRLNSIRNSHVQRGWADIGYHYAVDPSGRVWEGRPIRWQGAHVQDNNENNLGIVCMGNFDQHPPSAAQLAALDAFVADQARRYRVSLSRIYTHQEIKPTACPGRNLQRYLLASRASGRGRMALALA